MLCIHTLTEREDAIAVDGMCAQCLAVENGELRAEVQRLQKALDFWLPSIPVEESPRSERAAKDAWLLAGFEGPVMESAEDLGWIKMT
jgi:hypothetical protein